MVPATSGRLSVLFAGTMGVEGFTGFPPSASLFPIFISLCMSLGYHGNCADSFYILSCPPPGHPEAVSRCSKEVWGMRRWLDRWCCILFRSCVGLMCCGVLVGVI